ncbi:MAG TPA: nucleoside triphosphate pyrophosphohydrolase [Gammaproteobacteria bacterium]|nr:nucleoside triphosphate pyrophosphohydrolase [Gammaproteobacteria bacterium]
MEKLLEIMRQLRDAQGGCPWDREQDFRSIAPYTIEEAYEVVDAIEREDFAALRDELGDLLFQVVFHARMASEQGKFEFADVVEGISAKMQRRHPHVFAGETVSTADQQSLAWAAHKARERVRPGGAAPGLLDDVPPGLPALARAVKLGRLAAGAGFDWPDVAGVLDKLREELAELDDAMRTGPAGRIEAELGDLLFAAANLGRHLRIDPEAALRGSNRRFERRFSYIEDRLRAAGRDMRSVPPDELEAFWTEAKAREP